MEFLVLFSGSGAVRKPHLPGLGVQNWTKKPRIEWFWEKVGFYRNAIETTVVFFLYLMYNAFIMEFLVISLLGGDYATIGLREYIRGKGNG